MIRVRGPNGRILPQAVIEAEYRLSIALVTRETAQEAFQQGERYARAVITPAWMVIVLGWLVGLVCGWIIAWAVQMGWVGVMVLPHV